MYFTAAQISRSIDALAAVHPFHGITFLTCKQAKLPVGRQVVFALDAETDRFLREHHRIDPSSDWFFQPFKSSDAKKKWVRPDYAASGLQAINTQTFIKAFLHKPKSRIWGWDRNYVDVLAARLPRKAKIPAMDLAVWLFKDIDWATGTTVSDIVDRLVSKFSITEQEASALFEVSGPRGLNPEAIFQESQATWRDLQLFLPAPPDAKPDEGGTLGWTARLP